jgi:hypothetical protein
MKKIYLCALALSAGSMTFAQSLQQKMAFGVNKAEKEFQGNSVNNQKALGVVIWSDDFDTPGDWTIDNDGQTGSTFGWTIDAVSDGWWSSAGISSASGGNFAELSNGDPTQTPGTQAMNVTYTLTTANSLNLIGLGGSENVTLEFNQYGARFNDLQEIQISTDGTNFITVGDNLDKLVHSQSTNAPYPNPDFKTINLAPYLTASTATSVWIRFRWTTNFPGSASNPNVWVAYGWYLDDLKLRTNPDNDIAVTRGLWGSAGVKYYQVPSTQLSSFDFRADVINNGGNTASNAKLVVDVNSGSSVNTSPTKNINSLDSDSLETTFTPTGDGTYAFTWEVSTDSIDDLPADNMMVGETISIGGYIYASDADGATPGNAGGFDNSTTPATEEFEAGNFFDAYANDNVSAIDVFVGTNSTAGTIIDAVLYDVTSGSFVQVDRSVPVTLTAGDIGTMMTLVLPLKPAVTAGSNYFAAVHAYAGSGEFFYGSSGTSPDNTAPLGPTSLIFYPNMAAPATNQNYYTTGTPMVRMNFDPTIGVEELTTENVEFSVYPNPSNGVFTLNLNSDVNENVALNIRNVVGQNVITKTITVAGQTTETINLTNFSKGIYFLTVGSKTTKLIVE